MIQDMKVTLTRLFTVMMLIIVSMAAGAQVKVLFGEKGDDKFKSDGDKIEVAYDGGTIVVTQKAVDANNVTVYLAVTPNKGYTMQEKDVIEAYAVVPADINPTRGLTVSEKLTLKCDNFKDESSSRTYHATIDPNLALWVKSADFQKKRDGAKAGGDEDTGPDYSGTYYIGSVGYTANNDAGNYYLCPTDWKNWCTYKPDNDFYAKNTNSDSPFLTTFKCKTSAYSPGANNAVWVVEMDPYSGYYYIKHALDGKYMVSNGQIRTTNNPDRMRVHLESINPEDLNDKALFSIYLYNNSYLVISPKDLTDGEYYTTQTAHDTHKWLVVNGGNTDYLTGNNNSGQQAKQNGPTGYVNTTGIVGIYTEDDANAPFYLEPATIDPPTITNNWDNTITIAAETGATIYYTTDGTTPTTSSDNVTTSVTINVSGNTETIKAFAKSSSDYFPTIVKTYKLPKCDKPEFTLTPDGNHVTISCSTSDASIWYDSGVDNPDITPTTSYTTGTQIDIVGVSVVRAYSTKPGYHTSDMAYYYGPVEVSSSDDITNMNGNYLLASDFVSTASIGSVTNPFKGIIDGQFNTVHQEDALGYPLVAYADGAIIKNLIIGQVNITSGTDVGAICNVADGGTKIYNCGVLDGSVSGSGNVGGLVGLIQENSQVRVVNCFNYANVSGGNYAAGIVGKNGGLVGDVRIALCMMYGNVTGATKISPVYGGSHAPNVNNFTEYNYWLYSTTGEDGKKVLKDLDYTAYNDQLAIEKEEYLTRFPFYRHILNTHRELASYFLFGDYEKEHVEEIGHWTVDKSKGIYPIVEEWETDTHRTTVDIKAKLPNSTEACKGKLLNNIGDDGYYTGDGTKITAMGSSGYLTVNVYINGSKVASPELPITDMNEGDYDYTWGKVVLPFANEFTGWTRDWSKVCTGWEITTVGGQSTFSIPDDEPYNFYDRNNMQKDIYDADKNPYIFAQGGYYIVPYGVESIDIKAHFAKAFYLCDASYDIGYDTSYGSPNALGGSVTFKDDDDNDDSKYHGQTVYTDLAELESHLDATTNPHAQAIVLVGNFHFNVNLVGTKDGDFYNTPLDVTKAVTIMSTDEDNNQEPDYGWYTYNMGRLRLPPIRFDFVPNIEMGMSSRVNGSTAYPGIGILHARGWFEQTETCVSNSSQCEINSGTFTNEDNGHGNNRWIVNSGCFVQIIRNKSGKCNRLSYIQIGGNAYVKELYPGCHTDAAATTTIPTVPIAVTGGQVDECYMSGYNSSGGLSGDMIHFWCAGGKIGKFLGAYLDKPTQAGITAKVDHALIGRFFGGGTSVAARIKGDIDITIDNSEVDFYCGGPEFGNMETGKTVTTHATGTTFGEYYGAGFGGTSITYVRKAQNYSLSISGETATYDLDFSNYTSDRLNKATNGIGSCYKFEFLFNSNGSAAVSRFYTGYAQFDLATTGNVTNILNDCKIKELTATQTIIGEATRGEFYGAGCQGKVAGTVTSTLTGCTVDRSIYGGGFKAESNKVDVYTDEAPTPAVYTKETGIFGDFGEFPRPETYTWVQGDNDHDGVAGDAGTLYTSKNITMSELGNVTGEIKLTIDGGYVGGTAQGATLGVAATATTAAIPEGGNVYGGGNESKSLNNTIVTLKGDAYIYGNVFGGGNKAVVSGSTEVNIE